LACLGQPLVESKQLVGKSAIGAEGGGGGGPWGRRSATAEDDPTVARGGGAAGRGGAEAEQERLRPEHGSNFEAHKP